MYVRLILARLANEDRGRWVSSTDEQHNGRPKRDGDANDTSSRRIVRNGTLNVLGTMIYVPLNLVTVFVLARRLGAETLGVYFTIFAIAVVVHFILEAGITTVLTRRIAQSADRLRNHVAEAAGLWMLVSLCSFAAIMLCGIGWAHWKNESVPWIALSLAGVATIGRQLLEFSVGAFRGLERFEFENVARIIQAVLFCLLSILFVHDATGLNAAFVAFAVSNVAGGVFISLSLAWGWRCLGVRFSMPILKGWLSESIPVGFGDAVRRIAWQIDTVLLGIFQPAAAVGVYGIAYRPLQPLQIVPRTLASVTFPAMSRMAEEDKTAPARTFGQSVNLLWMMSLPICVAVTVYAVPLIEISAGSDFLPATVPLQILIWATALTFISSQFRFIYTAIGRQRTFSRLTTSFFVIQLVLQIAFIPMWGLYGACAGRMMGEFFLVLAGLYSCHRLGINAIPWWRMARAIPAAVLMAGLLYSVADQSRVILAATVIGGTALYFVLCALFGAVDRNELAHLAKFGRGVISRIFGRRRSAATRRESSVSDVSR